MQPWFKKDKLFGGETWTVESVSTPQAEVKLGVTAGDQFRIESFFFGGTKLSPKTGSKWSSPEPGEPIKMQSLQRKGANAGDPRRLYELKVIYAGQPKTFYLLEDQPDADHIAILQSNPDDPGANGGSASLRR